MANRNRSQMSAVLFRRLIERAQFLGGNINSVEKVRYIAKKDIADSELMSGADVTGQLVVSRHLRAITFSDSGQLYGAFFLPVELDLLPPGFAGTPLTPGTFAVSVVLSGIMPNATAAEIRDAIESDFQAEGSNYRGHDLEQISKLFPSMEIYKLDRSYEYTLDINRLVGAVATRIIVDGPLPFTQELQSDLINLFEGGSEFIPYFNVVQGFFSIYWGGFFIELYRCIEQLYSAPRLKELGTEINHGMPLKNLAIVLERHLAWRPKEDESLGKILSSCEQATLLKAANAFSIADADRLDTLPSRLSRVIYDMRNNLVHYRPIHQGRSYTDKQWDDIIRAMIGLVIDIYNTHGIEFNEIPT